MAGLAAAAACVVPDWRGALEAHFATSTFSSLAKFVARERCVSFQFRLVSIRFFFSLGRGVGAHRASNDVYVFIIRSPRFRAVHPPKTLQLARSIGRHIVATCLVNVFDRASHAVYPPPHSVFSALNLTPLSRVKGEWEKGGISGRRSWEDVRLR